MLPNQPGQRRKKREYRREIDVGKEKDMYKEKYLSDSITKPKIRAWEKVAHTNITQKLKRTFFLISQTNPPSTYVHLKIVFD
ncbi:hypothetical protein L6452_19748 [Arctium lappa]|uniref:Uncharacterized protein n=1 Tax=Arctium lappa TaxID=4217 RepID=A0ACB9BBA5_ARCLA|nr:hypothetical protein L6452_19748 [Arctium lappa]